MGMPKGSQWKRLAVFSDILNQEHGPDIAHLLWANLAKALGVSL